MLLLYATFLLFTGAMIALLHANQRILTTFSTGKAGSGPEPMHSVETPTEKVKWNPETQLYKTLYYRLQNLEQFPEILPFAQKTLLSFLRQGMLLARIQNGHRNILNITKYHPDQLAKFMAAKRQDTHDDWSSYLRRRGAGGGTEMFVDREAARQWIKLNAPLQLVDGAWVARIHNITTPFALRGITKDAWQTYCEELGDGELEKNHCYIYMNLLREIGFHLPDQNEADFIHPRHELDDDRIWRAGAGHLLISLFPNEFLPEVLGFNLHYESLAPQTLKAAKELPELGISGYYFAVHICIDNADSGHSAMAEATIRKYIDHVRSTGEMDVEQAWKRIQAGYLLSEYLDGDADINQYKEAVAGMIQRKAGVAGQVHCGSRARIGGRKITEWFSPKSNLNDDFLTALAHSPPWVYPGDSERSLLVRELSWKGRMFGAFTSPEVQCLRTWIDLLDSDTDDNDVSAAARKYSTLVGRSDNSTTNTSDDRSNAAVAHPAVPPQRKLPGVNPNVNVARHDFVVGPRLQLTQCKLEALLPLWFVHPCLLEHIVFAPHRTTTSLGSIVLQLLRAESGYILESAGIAGMDEQRAAYSPSLTELGLQIVRKNKLSEPTCLKDVLCDSEISTNMATDFANTILAWATRPVANGPFLFGLARAFIELEEWVAGNEALLGYDDRRALEKIVARKHDCLDEILKVIKAEGDHVERFISGYEFGRIEMEKLLS